MQYIKAWDMADPKSKDVTRVSLFTSKTGEWTDITDCVQSMEVTMDCFDHYPFSDGMSIGLLQSIHDMLSMVTVQPPAAPPLPPRVKFGGYYICQGCQLEVSYCGCAKAKPPPPPTHGDGESSDLSKRIRDWKGKP